MFKFLYILFLFFSLNNITNFAFVQGDNFGDHDELGGNGAYVMEESLTDQRIEEDEDNQLLQEVKQKIEYYRKKKKASKNLKKTEIRSDKLVLQELKKRQNKGKKTLRDEFKAPDWSNVLFCGVGTFTCFVLCLYKIIMKMVFHLIPNNFCIKTHFYTNKEKI